MSIVALLTLAGDSKAGGDRPHEVDWDSVATCVWERWDSGADMAPVLRFCMAFSAAGEYR